MMYYILLITLCFMSSVFCADEAVKVSLQDRIGATTDHQDRQAAKIAETGSTVTTTPDTTTPAQTEPINIPATTQSIPATTPTDVVTTQPTQAVTPAIQPANNVDDVIVEEDVEDITLQPGVEDKELAEFRKYVEQYVDTEDTPEDTNSN